MDAASLSFMIVGLAVALAIAFAAVWVTRPSANQRDEAADLIDRAMTHISSMHAEQVTLNGELTRKLMAFSEGGLKQTQLELELSASREKSEFLLQELRAKQSAREAVEMAISGGEPEQRWKDQLNGTLG